MKNKTINWIRDVFIFLVLILPLFVFLWFGRGVFKFSKNIIGGIYFEKEARAQGCWTVPGTPPPPSDCNGGGNGGDCASDCSGDDCCSDCDPSTDCCDCSGGGGGDGGDGGGK